MKWWSRYTGYKKFRYFSETVIGEDALEMLRLSLETIALWVELPDRFTDLVEKHNLDFPGGIHAIEHAMIAMYPLRLLADKNDVGGVSTPGNNDLDGNCGIFVYDGFAFKLFFFLFPDILFKHFTFFPDR